MTMRRLTARVPGKGLPREDPSRLREQRDLLERPFFALGKCRRVTPIDYVSPDGKVFLRVLPDPQWGMATIWDADVLLFATSVIHGRATGRERDLSRVIECRVADILRATGRGTGGRDRDLLDAALRRLESTMVETNLRARGTGEGVRQFRWIERVERAATSMRLTLPDWFVEGAIEHRGVLAINPAYFELQGGRERWFYRVARKHAGGAGPGGFAISLPTLFEKSGVEGTYMAFKHAIAALVRANALPEFALRFEASKRGGEPNVRMVRRAEIGDDIAAMPPPDTRRRSAHTACAVVTHQAVAPATFARLARDFPGAELTAVKQSFDDWIDGDLVRQPTDYDAAFETFARCRLARAKRDFGNAGAGHRGRGKREIGHEIAGHREGEGARKNLI